MSVMTSGLRVASDVGGTFTDNLAYDPAEKRVTVAKVPTTPENRALGTVRGLRRALEEQGRGGGDVVYVGHGMTTATNALLQRSGARIAFITNEGFRDLLLIGRQNRPSLYDIRKTRPAAARRARGLPHGARPARPRRERDRAARRGGVAPCRRAAARRPGRGGGDLLAARLRQPGARAAGPGDPRRRAARRTGLSLDRHPRRVPRVRARQHGDAERLSAAGHGELPRQPDRTARRSGRRARAGGRTCRSWSWKPPAA